MWITLDLEIKFEERRKEANQLNPIIAIVYEKAEEFERLKIDNLKQEVTELKEKLKVKNNKIAKLKKSLPLTPKKLKKLRDKNFKNYSKKVLKQIK